MTPIVNIYDGQATTKIFIPNWKLIVVHHSLTKDGTSVSWNAIRKYHVKERKWTDIGYHFGIENINNKYNILVGRPLTTYGAHTKGKNEVSIGICFVGNYDLIEPPEDMLKFAVKYLIVPLMGIFKIAPNKIVTHNKFASYKSCPGTKFKIGLVRKLVADHTKKWQ